ncbi:MAG: exodeoxyribonuclease VII small subunit [Minisyncoccia bacterium]|jgi:exodeoxyribonuclease VII small subunit
MAKPTPSKVNLNESLKQLAKIVVWFEEQEEVDVEKGLEYVKEGVELIKTCKARLSQVENEFKEIKRDLEDDGEGGEGPQETIPEGNGEELPF